MFKSKVFMKFIGFIFLISPTIAAAETVILGEYKGIGKLNVTVLDENKNKSEYQNNCHLALNIDRSANSLDIPFGVFTCEAGMDSWNEQPFHLDIVGTKLFQDQQEVGSIAADGTISFELYGTSTVKYSISRTDDKCQLLGMDTVTLKLNNRLKYVLKPINNNSYLVSRIREADTLQTVYRKAWPKCPSGIDYVVHHTTRSISATLSR
jgi:hypothetical protein